MLSAADGCGVDNLTTSELLSAVFSVCNNVIVVLLMHSEGIDKQHNVEVVQDAIAKLYALVTPKIVN